MLGSFGAYVLMLGHAGVQAPRRDTRHRTFHVKHAQGDQAKMCLHIFIWEPQGVGLWQSQRPNVCKALKLQFAAGYHEATGGSVPAKDCPENCPCRAERIYE